MAIEDRRARERATRRQLITSAARAIAAGEGWDAVTTRRLSAEIEYSQPVIYKHFASLGEITDAVALEGFDELAIALREARARAASGEAVRAVARRYADFAAESPALYDAMFLRGTRLPFGADPPSALSAAFGELREAIALSAGDDDPDMLTEVLWAALHGAVVLDRAARLRPDRGRDRIDLIVRRLVAEPS